MTIMDITNPTRTRGRRRRGRKSTHEQVEEKQQQQQVEPPHLVEPDKPEQVTDDKTDKNKQKKRYCIGRKPVTDFVVGQSYTATVVYSKPFGIFLDIGCHSDAFCHVSRCSDDYIDAHQMQTLFPPGKVLTQKARVVEIQPKQKRITVSMQSEARLEDELQSIQARQARSEKRKHSKDKDYQNQNTNVETKKRKTTTSTLYDDQQQQQPASSVQTEIPVIKTTQNDDSHAPNENAVGRGANSKITITTRVEVKPQSEMTHAELKRARKIARRAARRAQQEEA